VNRNTARSNPYEIANTPWPARCIARERGAMNVYSIVPSQRSQATVSIRNSNSTPRYAQMTAPMRRLVDTALTSISPPVASMPWAM